MLTKGKELCRQMNGYQGRTVRLHILQLTSKIGDYFLRISKEHRGFIIEEELVVNSGMTVSGESACSSGVPEDSYALSTI